MEEVPRWLDEFGQFDEMRHNICDDVMSGKVPLLSRSGDILSVCVASIFVLHMPEASSSLLVAKVEGEVFCAERKRFTKKWMTVKIKAEL